MKETIVKNLKNVLPKRSVVDGHPITLKWDYGEVADKLIEGEHYALPAMIGQRVYAIATPCGECKKKNLPLAEALEVCRKCRKLTVETVAFDYDLIPEWGRTVFAKHAQAANEVKRLREEERNEQGTADRAGGGSTGTEDNA